MLGLLLTLSAAAQEGKTVEGTLSQDLGLLPALEAKGPVLSLTHCVELAFQHHPVLAAARDEVTQAQAAIDQVWALYYPTAGIAANRILQGTESSDSTGNNLLGISLTSPASALGVGGALLTNQVGAAVGVTQTIFDGGQRKEQLVGAREGLKSKIYSFQGTGLSQYQQIQEAYADTLEAELINATNRDNLVRAELSRDVTQRFYDLGEKARTDVTQAETQIASAQVQVAQSKSDVRTARIHLAQVVGVPLATIQGNSLENVLVDPVELPPRADALAALDKNPGLLALEAGAAANRSMERLQWKTLLPTLTGQAGYGVAGFNIPDIRFWSVGLQLIIPFYQAGVEPSAEKFKATADQLDHQREAMKLTLLEAMDKAYSDVQGAQERATAAARQIKLSVQNYWLSFKRYRGGVSEITELLNARGYVAQAQSSYIQALHDGKVAEGQFYEALGFVPRLTEPVEHARPRGLQQVSPRGGTEGGVLQVSPSERR